MNKKDELVGSIAQSFYEIGRYINRHLSQDQSLTPPQFFILFNIFTCGKSTVSSLGSKLGLTSGATTIAANRLVESGLLSRIRDEEDRRVVWIDITDSGKNLMEEFNNRRNDLWGQVFADFKNEELIQFLELLKKVNITKN
ncbi:MarR family winged helix-turn-helix transcriptional regulator [Falsibacillus pallidus]|uniref:MarR family transcriptional regulator n=1 Tax=Falsibacillus pallidus TaxID=493781 RepID=A0A370GF58_9BACI|nr:MarR family winged helix-turn-helix transcriptional regulator [Falsibacillus pallidus]RDI42317.1 MarR family transcriptional regulator [Falsibacillus pallidus]